MLKTVIKRDGSQEPAQPAKLNGWSEWSASEFGSYVDWVDIALATAKNLPEVCTSRDLMNALIKECLERDTYYHNRMAGRLYAATIHKDLYGVTLRKGKADKGRMPTVQEVHKNLQDVGYMRVLDYSDEEYAEINTYIKHSRDFKYAHFQLHHIRYKYALRNRITGQELESPQFVFMRMAMALGETQPRERRLADVKNMYELFSRNVINAPTPNYVNLGTHLNGYASCCLYTTHDTAHSLAVGDHIGYMMTVQSAGIGNNLQTRSIGDAVRGGLIKHQGKTPYYRSMQTAVSANVQNGRAGACTTYYSAFDPEVSTLVRLKNPRTPAAKQIRGMDYNQMSNLFFAEKVANDEEVFLFNIHTAPDLHAAFYSADTNKFKEIYARYEADPNFKKTYVRAREILLTEEIEAYETGRAYVSFMDEINRHTPYTDTIYSSNLCAEVVEPTYGYSNMEQLYTNGSVGRVRFKVPGDEWLFQAVDAIRVEGLPYPIAATEVKPGMKIISEHLGTAVVEEVLECSPEPEVALCSLGGIVITNVANDEEYELAMYYALLMVDKCIHMSDYPLPHVGYTAKNRLAAAIGIMDLAHHMARKKLKYSSKAGKEEIHRVAERHMYFAIKGSLRLAKELGNCPWSHRTKWARGWLPIDTYNRNVDKIVQTPYQYDWESLRSEVVANGGIRNSALVAYMPGESSSKASGTANSVYPVRELTMIKTDNALTTYWCAPHSDKLGRHYEPAWEIPTADMIDCYGVIQKFTDQAISADLYRKITGSEKIGSSEMIQNYIRMALVGMKTRYYTNTHTAGAFLEENAEGRKVGIIGGDVESYIGGGEVDAEAYSQIGQGDALEAPTGLSEMEQWAAEFEGAACEGCTM